MSTTLLTPYKDKYINTSTGEITLGTAAKSVDSAVVAGAGGSVGGAKKRELRYKLQATARKLLPNERVAQCMHRCGHGGVAVQKSKSTGLASFSGVVTCGSVWTCPVCSAKISNGRRNELNTLLAWARRENYKPVLLTLTARHSYTDSLFGMLLGMKAAKKKLHQSRAWRAIDPDVVGHVTATEVTHGGNGWHVHFHMIVIVKTAAAVVALANLQDVWLHCLAHKDIQLSGNGHAFQAQGGDAAGEYVTKWGAGEELTMGGEKRSKGGRTPWELLAGAESDPAAAALFVEYAACFKGTRQLVWSQGLKRVVNILEVADQALADAPEGEDLETIAVVPKRIWRLVVRRNLQAELLQVAEEWGAAGVESWCIAVEVQDNLRKKGM